MKHLLLALAGAAMLCSCADKKADTLAVIDLSGNLGCPDTGNAAELFEVKQIVCPEVTDSTMLTFPEVCGMDGNDIYLLQMTMEGGRLLVMDMESGKCLSSFDHTGQGPGEYSYISSAQKQPASAGWSVFCINENKIFNYTPGGEFTGEQANSVISEIYSLADGWIATNRRSDGANKVFYRYKPDWTLMDSVVTSARFHITREGVSSVTDVQPAGRVAYWLENDTLHEVPVAGEIHPVIAFELGDKKMPEFDSYETELRERDKYLRYSVFVTGSEALLFYRWGDALTMQLYDMADGSLLYSGSSPMDNPGLPLEVEGHTLHCAPRGVTPDGDLIFMASGEEASALSGVDDSNPAILRVHIRR